MVRHRRGPVLGPRYWRVWTAASISTLGDGVRYVAFPLIAAALTRDPRAIAFVAAMGFLPQLLFGLIGGAVADRVDRRMLMWRIDVVRAALMGALAVALAAGDVSILGLASAAFLLGAATTGFDSAASSILPMVVDPAGLERANAWLFSSQTVAASFLGAPLGGLLFAVTDWGPAAVDAVSFAAAAAIVASLRGPFGAGGSNRAPSTLRADVAEGLRWLWRHRLLRTLCILLSAMNGTAVAAEAVLVVYAQDVLHLDNLGYALLLTALAAGAVAGSALAPPFGRRFGGRAVVVTAVAAQGVSLAGLGLTSNLAVTAAMLAVTGATSMLWTVATVSLRQKLVPAPLLGRVTSAYRVIGLGTMPIGAAAGGVVAAQWGIHAPYVLSAVVVLAFGAACLPIIRWPATVESSRTRRAPVGS